MTTQRQQDRRAAIEAAAYDVLQDKGYSGASMLAIARAAKSSNQTLYKWYGDKKGLFSALIAANAEEVRALLAEEKDNDPQKTLERLGPSLYRLLTSDRAIALNRAAAADPSGELGPGPRHNRARHRWPDDRHAVSPPPRSGHHHLRHHRRSRRSVSRPACRGPPDPPRHRHLGAPGPAAVSARAEAATQRFLVLMSPEVYPGWQPKPDTRS